MYTSPYIICEYCDSVYHRPQLSLHQKALCQRCGAVVARHNLLSIDQSLALSVAAGMLLLFICFYPVLMLKAQDQINSASLFDTVLALAEGPISLMALMSAFAIVFVPALQVVLMIWLLVHARGGVRAPAFRGCMRALAALRPWGMLEVFLLGCLVAVVKLKGPLDAAPTLGLFALGFLSLLMIGMAGRDVHLLWEKLP
ncbi:paraquat-inducible protein A [Marinobacter fonticola]|uniref:paraquat-inducible protein A n=1 Tax=Marinobacter fonticola TaxID=2603215 RepID=UPI0011E694CB|nr:paraquat-inducible protein A [Marinobacter fonticola]